jgi:hypothetical protein
MRHPSAGWRLTTFRSSSVRAPGRLEKNVRGNGTFAEVVKKKPDPDLAKSGWGRSAEENAPEGETEDSDIGGMNVGGVVVRGKTDEVSGRLFVFQDEIDGGSKDFPGLSNERCPRVDKNTPQRLKAGSMDRLCLFSCRDCGTSYDSGQ